MTSMLADDLLRVVEALVAERGALHLEHKNKDGRGATLILNKVG